MNHRACATCIENATRARTRAAIAAAAAAANGPAGAGAGGAASRSPGSGPQRGEEGDDDAQSQGSGAYGDLASTAGPRDGAGEDGKVDEEGLANLTLKHEELLMQVWVHVGACGCMCMLVGVEAQSPPTDGRALEKLMAGARSLKCTIRRALHMGAMEDGGGGGRRVELRVA